MADTGDGLLSRQDLLFLNECGNMKGRMEAGTGSWLPAGSNASHKDSVTQQPKTVWWLICEFELYDRITIDELPASDLKSRARTSPAGLC